MAQFLASTKPAASSTVTFTPWAKPGHQEMVELRALRVAADTKPRLPDALPKAET